MSSAEQNKAQIILSKVPEVTIFFWIIKILCTTVGETFSDFINVTLGVGLVPTTIIMGIAFLIVGYLQFRAVKYIPGLYWFTVVLISVFGTLVTDNLTDGMGVPLEVSTIVFSILLLLTFLLWYLSEKTLSIHSVFTRKREAFYWSTILFTFALGTAVGDLYSEQLGLGYLPTGLIVAGIIISVFLAWKFLKLDAVLAFWVAYIFTRPLGASLGDYLSQPVKYGGLGLGATITSVIFLLAILGIIVYLGLTKYDTVKKNAAPVNTLNNKKQNVFIQTIVVLFLFLAAGTGSYAICSNNIARQADSSLTSLTGQLSDFVTIENDMLNAVNAKDFAAAKTKADDLEHNWDVAAARLKSIDKTAWTDIDGTIDSVLADVRSGNQDVNKCVSAINASLSTLNSTNKK
ncbi:COG4705 family protein [Anaerocolumna jejuensis]|uniref:COG4705 family protein n=1 Tax=Anaerocolumna jejuensis TaxID=259063 RepID=UPI003F7B7B29